jgi:hypothetical protein
LPPFALAVFPPLKALISITPEKDVFLTNLLFFCMILMKKTGKPRPFFAVFAPFPVAFFAKKNRRDKNPPTLFLIGFVAESA